MSEAVASVASIDVVTLAKARSGVASATTDDALANAVLLDVREPWEFDLARIDGSVNVPMSALVSRIDAVRELQGSAETPIVLICHHGIRSMQCARYLANQGLQPLINLTGGIDAWSTHVDRAVPTY